MSVLLARTSVSDYIAGKSARDVSFAFDSRVVNKVARSVEAKREVSKKKEKTAAILAS
jgi:hypothetical protein